MVDGDRAAPLEGCGGVPGYEDLVTALADPERPDHAHLVEWYVEVYGGVPADFDAAQVDIELDGVPGSSRLGWHAFPTLLDATRHPAWLCALHRYDNMPEWESLKDQGALGRAARLALSRRAGEQDRGCIPAPDRAGTCRHPVGPALSNGIEPDGPIRVEVTYLPLAGELEAFLDAVDALRLSRLPIARAVTTEDAQVRISRFAGR